MFYKNQFISSFVKKFPVESYGIFVFINIYFGNLKVY